MISLVSSFFCFFSTALGQSFSCIQHSNFHQPTLSRSAFYLFVAVTRPFIHPFVTRVHCASSHVPSPLVLIYLLSGLFSVCYTMSTVLPTYTMLSFYQFRIDHFGGRPSMKELVIVIFGNSIEVIRLLSSAC